MFRNFLNTFAVIVCAASLTVGCAKSTGTAPDLNTGTQETPNQDDANNTPEEWLAEPQNDQNQELDQLGQLVILTGIDGTQFVELAVGPQLTFQNVVYWNVVEQSIFDGRNLRTVYVSQNGTQIIVQGTVVMQAGIPFANCQMFRVGPNNGNRVDLGVREYRRPKMSRQRRAAYRACREAFPRSLDRLSPRNKRQRWACQRQVARRTFSDEGRSWRDSVFGGSEN